MKPRWSGWGPGRRARFRARAQFFWLCGVDADREALGLEHAHGLLQMWKGRVRQAADIDHIGAGRAHRAGAVEDVFDTESRGIDDLGKDADVIAREVETASSLAEI